jgi:hypothetical protein
LLRLRSVGFISVRAAIANAVKIWFKEAVWGVWRDAMISERVKVHVGLAAAVVVLIVCMVLLLVGTLYRGDLRAALPGSVAPDFALRDADNNPVELSALRGDVVIVYFRGEPGDAPAPTTSPSVLSALPSAQSSPTPIASALPTKTAGSAVPNAGSPAAWANADLSQLAAVCKQANNSRLKVLELTNSASLQLTDPVASLHTGTGGAVQTLIDSAGDVARQFRVDETDTKPTFFIIDPAGIIRYRGNSLQGSAATATDELAAPTTQASSCPQLVQTLLSTEAVNLGVPTPTHF